MSRPNTYSATVALISLGCANNQNYAVDEVYLYLWRIPPKAVFLFFNDGLENYSPSAMRLRGSWDRHQKKADAASHVTWLSPTSVDRLWVASFQVPCSMSLQSTEELSGKGYLHFECLSSVMSGLLWLETGMLTILLSDKLLEQQQVVVVDDQTESACVWHSPSSPTVLLLLYKSPKALQKQMTSFFTSKFHVFLYAQSFDCTTKFFKHSNGIQYIW